MLYNEHIRSTTTKENEMELAKDQAMRKAKKSDFKVGAHLHTYYEGYDQDWVIQRHYTQGIWEARSSDGYRCSDIDVYEDEAKFYKVII
jgi:hypothetical protein